MLKKQNDTQGLCFFFFFGTKLRNSPVHVKQANCTKIQSWHDLGWTFVVSKELILAYLNIVKPKWSGKKH